MSNFSLEADMRRAKERCPACARQQLQIENGQYVPGEEIRGQLHATPRGGGSSRRARAAAAAAAIGSSSGGATPASSGGTGRTVGSGDGGSSNGHSGSRTRRENSLAQHEVRPEQIICNHCMCSNEKHEDTGPNGQRCCGGLREGPWDRVCDLCKVSDSCRAWGRGRACPAANKAVTAAAEGAPRNGAAGGDEAGGEEASGSGAATAATGEKRLKTGQGAVKTAPFASTTDRAAATKTITTVATIAEADKPCKTEGRANFCKHCTCPCAERTPHKFDHESWWMSINPEIQRSCAICLPCWSGWCFPKGGTKRRLVGVTTGPEEPFARQWRPGRDADVVVLTGLFDEMTGLLPADSWPFAVFGKSLRYFKGLAGDTEAKHALREAGIDPGHRSGAIGEAWSGGGSMYPPERPAGARKVVAAPLRQGEGANRHFSRQHGRRNHNWQWDMLKSPWSLGLMAKGRLALGVSEEEACEFEEAGIIAFPGHVVKHKDTVKNGGYGKTIGTLVLRSPEPAFVCVQVQGERLGKAVAAAHELGYELPPRFEEKGRFKFAIDELDAWAMVGGAARNEAEHAVVCGRTTIPEGEPGEGFVRVAFNMRWGWQDDRRV